MKNIIATTIFCDDIRQEIGSKQSFMGVYNADLVVGEFPVSLIRFCALVKIQFPLDTAAQSILIRIFDNDTPIAEISAPDGALQAARAAVLQKGEIAEDQTITFSTAIQFAPLNLSQPTVLRVRAIIDGSEVKANGIRVRLPTEDELAAVPATLAS
jgi:hypothetical protein